MCGQVGILFGLKRRTKQEYNDINQCFLDLLQLSERRGPHATGMVSVDTCGQYQLCKRPITAYEFISEPQVEKLLKHIGNQTTVLMGHTRWRTRGSEEHNPNNHPIRAGMILGTHNGTVYNADLLFSLLGLPRFAEVDSELIFRIADECATFGHIDPQPLKRLLRLCRGQMSAVFTSRLDPEKIVIIKGNKPLFFYYHPIWQVIAYASEKCILEDSLCHDDHWQPLTVPKMSIAIFNHQNLLPMKRYRLDFQAQSRKQEVAP